ncbi:hypothetical protein BY458DRAFT_554484 [Sporodiniella umbellata]|nr:hypothetical protein BY458DRAFT_554484 [Sporodiniella umbellata]
MDDSDAFSQTLEARRRQQSRQSINRLSRAFESTHLDKPILPSKPLSLREQTKNEPPLSFSDIRARFQKESTIPIQPKTTYRPHIPLKPSKTGPTLPEKVIVPARTGPPSLPAKPRLREEDFRPRTDAPAIVPRTETGNSMISTSSTTSSQSSSKRGWHSSMISSWFNNNNSSSTLHHPHETLKNSIKRQTTQDSFISVSPQFTGSKRKKVITELLETEKTYQRDMNVLRDIYFDQSTKYLSSTDVRHLFCNLLEIIEFEKSFVSLLEHSCEQDSVGTAFRESMRTIDRIYSEYCKRHEDAVLKLQELESRVETLKFLNDCQAQLQGKTASWDLGSLLIKPVQRVLKYPLLIKEILSLTSPEHSDHDDLASALKEIGEVADNINEIKRRKDIVEKIVGEKKKTEINATGFSIEPTHDLLFEALHAKFEDQQENVRQLARDVQGWVRHIKILFENLHQLSCSFETLYNTWGGVRVKSLSSIEDFSKAADLLSSSLSRELDNDVREFVYSRINDLLKAFENPAQVIHKRSLKMLDYDRVRGMKSKGDIPDKALQESADIYVHINAQLMEELPKFFDLTDKYFDILIGGLVHVQLKFFGLIRREWINLVDQHLDKNYSLTYQQIITKQIKQFEKVDIKIQQIDILYPERYKPMASISSLAYPGHLASSTSLTSIDAPNQSYDTQSRMSVKNNTKSKNFECTVLYDYHPCEQDKLNVKRGDTVSIQHDMENSNEDWWYATCKNRRLSGWVPVSYCQRL